VSNARFWETPDELTTISLCAEGCVHLRVGRAVIKLTKDEFLALVKLTDKAAREMRFPEVIPVHPHHTGH